MNDVSSIPTRQSLLARLKDVGDQESWREFFDIYWRLIHDTALKAGLKEAEAHDVVQEVMIAAAKKMPGFTYDPQGLSPRDTARALGVSTAAVHLAKHRVGRLVKTELKRLGWRED